MTRVVLAALETPTPSVRLQHLQHLQVQHLQHLQHLPTLWQVRYYITPLIYWVAAGVRFMPCSWMDWRVLKGLTGSKLADWAATHAALHPPDEDEQK